MFVKSFMVGWLVISCKSFVVGWPIISCKSFLVGWPIISCRSFTVGWLLISWKTDVTLKLDALLFRSCYFQYPFVKPLFFSSNTAPQTMKCVMHTHTCSHNFLCHQTHIKIFSLTYTIVSYTV